MHLGSAGPKPEKKLHILFLGILRVYDEKILKKTLKSPFI